MAERKPLGHERIARDPRTAIHVMRTADGRVEPLTGETLERRAAQWVVPASTPEDVRARLATARRMWALGAVEYELFTVAAVWAVLGLEQMLRSHYPTPLGGKVPPFEKLTQRARAEGLVTDAVFEQLDAGRRLRNSFAHPSATVLNPPLAATLLEATHTIARVLFREPDRTAADVTGA